MSTTGTSVVEVARTRWCGAPMTSRSDSREHLVERHEVGVGGDVGVGAEHPRGLEPEEALQLVAEARADVVALAP